MDIARVGATCRPAAPPGDRLFRTYVEQGHTLLSEFNVVFCNVHLPSFFHLAKLLPGHKRARPRSHSEQK